MTHNQSNSARYAKGYFDGYQSAMRDIASLLEGGDTLASSQTDEILESIKVWVKDNTRPDSE